jgi:hypothetical protein
VGERKQKIEELKDKVYETYSKCYDPSLDRQKHTGLLWELASRWCKNFILKNDNDIFYEEKIKIKKDIVEISLNDMGEEIFDTIRGYINKEIMPKDEFLLSFRAALDNAISLYYRNKKKEKDSITEPRIIKTINKIIEEETRNEGRKLTPDEKVDRISRYIPLREKTIREHLESMDRKIINYVQDKEKREEVQIVESMTDHSTTMKKPVSNPENEAMENIEAEIIKNALETVINEYHDKMEPFYRALFTMRCIKNNMNYERLRPILSADILEKFERDGKIPAQYEIYMIFHPKADKSTAETNASQMSKKLYTDIKKAIKEKYPDFEF